MRRTRRVYRPLPAVGLADVVDGLEGDGIGVGAVAMVRATVTDDNPRPPTVTSSHASSLARWLPLVGEK